MKLLLGVLGVWRITHLLQGEDGPWEIVVRLRRRAGPGFFGGLLDCFACLSLWMSVPFAWSLGRDRRERALLWPALSAAAMLIERAAAPPPAAYFEAGDDDDVLR